MFTEQIRRCEWTAPSMMMINCLLILKGMQDGLAWITVLKKRGFKFVGSTIVYAFMQAVGMVDDHMAWCPRHTNNRK